MPDTSLDETNPFYLIVSFFALTAIWSSCFSGVAGLAFEYLLSIICRDECQCSALPNELCALTPDSLN